MAKFIDLHGLEQFNIHCEQSQQGVLWKRWLRSFDLFAEGRGVTKFDQKRSLLLHCAGLEVQDIFFTLEEENGTNVYDKVVKTLNKYFVTKINVPYERYQFRQMAQLQSETVEQYVSRLRQRAKSCEFEKTDEQIRDQVIEKCVSSKLRTKLLEKGQDLELNDLCTMASTMELAQSQSKSIESQQCQQNGAYVNKVSNGSRQKWSARSAPRRQPPPPLLQLACYRCGKNGHKSADMNCPARNKRCDRCKLIGHFKKCCKTQMRKNPNRREFNSDKRQGHVQNVEYASDNEEYTFTVGGQSEKVTLSLNDIDVDFIIDSGSSVNLIDKELWESLKLRKIRCKTEKTDKKLFPYGAEKPLKILGKLTVDVTVKNVNGKYISMEIYVMDGKGPALLGKECAIELNLLKLGVNLIKTDDLINKYDDVFQGVGRLKNFQLKLSIDETVPPVAQKPYRIPLALQKRVSDKLDELEAMDIIERVDEPSSWVSPAIIVPKKNNDIRIVTDMRQANVAIQRERHPIPTVDEILYKMNEAEVFSKLDLTMAFHQIELEESSRYITTFVTQKGLYCHKTLNFGVNAAPEKYQKIISQVFADCEGVENMADDLIVHAKDKAQHDTRLEKVFERLREKNLTLNRAKCQFGLDKITYMGHILSKHGIEPTEDRVKALKNAPRPINAKQTRSFLGLVNYSSKFIENYAILSEPLRRVTRQDSIFIWGEEQEKSYQLLKNALSSTSVLGYFRMDAEKTQLIVDSSGVGLAAVLVQRQDGETRVISYASRLKSDVEKRYSATESEDLAVVWGVMKFHMYLYEINFEILTDHKSLCVLFGLKSKPSARIERWMLQLMPYSYTIKYIKGEDNCADVLSRLIGDDKLPHDKFWEQESEWYVHFVSKEAVPNSLSLEEIEKCSREDDELTQLRNSYHQAQWDKTCVDYFPIRDEISCVGDIVLRGTRIVIPKELRTRCVELAHEGHLGQVGTKERLRTKCYWPKMHVDVEKYVTACKGCQLVGSAPKPELMKPTELPPGPWQDIAMDILGPLDNGVYVVTVIDYYSRYYEQETTKNITSERMIEILDKLICRYGYVESIRTDNGRQFVSDMFEKYLKDLNIIHHKTTPLFPSANGEIERQNRSLMKRIKIARAERKDWKREIQTYLMSYRSTPHSVTNKSPSELFFQRQMKTKLPQIGRDRVNDEELRDTDRVHKYKNKLYIDQKRQAEPRDLMPGDKVLLRKTQKGKMDTNYETVPYTLIKKFGNQCVLKSEDGVIYKRNSTFVKKMNEFKGND